MPAARAYVERISAAAREVQRTTRTALDIRYGDDYWQKIDVYLPADETARELPVLCFMHGGAWVNGTKEWMGFMAPAILALPAIFVSVNYRLAPAARYPAPLHDCFDAVAWVRRNIVKFNGDGEAIFIGGHSAGGHLAALVTLRRDLAAAHDLPPDVIKACFPVSGAFDLRTPNPAPGSMEEQVYKSLLARPEDDADASPLLHAAGNHTPFFITWGSRDFPPLITQGRAMAAALAEQPGPLAVREFADLDHFEMSEENGRMDGAWVSTVHRWMKFSFD